MRMLRGTTAAALAGLLIGSLWGTAGFADDPSPGPSPSPENSGPAPDEFSATADDAVGIGEKMIIVVGTLNQESLAADFAASNGFGDMQGYYLGAAKHYEVLGFYIQTTPDWAPATCKVPNEYTPPDRCDGSEDRPDALQSVPPKLKYQSLDPSVDSPAAYCASYAGEYARRCLASAKLAQALSVPLPGGWLALSAFRTKTGAQDFIEAARAYGVTVMATLRVVKTAGLYVGLGQEPHPDGSGPLLTTLPDIDLYQI